MTVNPNDAQCPNYLLDIYHVVRAPFVTLESTHQQAAVILTMVWEAQNTVEKLQWQQQIDCDMEELEERRQEVEEVERLRQEVLDKEKEEQHKEEEKKNKSKFIHIPQRGVPTMPLIIVSTIATCFFFWSNFLVHSSLIECPRFQYFTHWVCFCLLWRENKKPLK